MSSIAKETFDFYDTAKDLRERKQIINDYAFYGIIDRDKVIKKITELQQKDAEVVAATNTAQTMRGAVDLKYADDNTLIVNLQFQIDILEKKLAAKAIKEVVEEK